MISHSKHSAIALLLAAFSIHEVADAFAPSLQPRVPFLASTPLAAEGFAPATTKERPTAEKTEGDGESSIDVDMTAAEVKSALIELIPRMTGQAEEYRAVESYVNMLEANYSPVQTIDFLNLAVSGEWQLLFSTNLMGRATKRMRLTELVQKIDASGFSGNITNSAEWLYAENGETFDAYGQFSVQCSYTINQGARMVVDLDGHELRPARGSKIPGDVPELVAYLNRAIPKEIFDPSGHAMDTSYLDADLRIVRMTGPSHEGVRDIFMRKGSLEINPN